MVLHCILGPIFYLEEYSKMFLIIRILYSYKLVLCLVMTITNSYQSKKILDRVERRETPMINHARKMYHAIVLPVYKEGKDISAGSPSATALQAQ